ncbi:hypothetical protein BB558_004697 [Smittium angustum]|uniref:NADPH-dependent diflavin oxidoreductase 1 n=1 Tax=Smittium angustum TaxID=133377 RepID=A0A2U1J2G7_SMIAN|nr:hypothetical protein BB558_004697 [Smittium angustum]
MYSKIILKLDKFSYSLRFRNWKFSRCGLPIFHRFLEKTLQNRGYILSRSYMENKLIVFFCSTTGQGNEPETMKAFWKLLLKKSLSPDTCKELKFAVFGLGDSSYEKYNFVAKKLFRRLKNLGATDIVELGLGDDQHYLGLDGALDKWIPRLFEEIYKICGSVKNTKENIIDINVLPKPQFSIQLYNDNYNTRNPPTNVPPNFAEIYSMIGHSRVSVVTGTVLSNIRITAEDHFQDVRSITFKPNTDVIWNPGDYVNVFPKNSNNLVTEFLDLVGYSTMKNSLLKISKSKNETNAKTDDSEKPFLISFWDLVKNYVDINSVPRRSFFKWCSYFTKSEAEKEKLLELSDSSGIDLYYSYCVIPKRTVLEVLYDFSGLHNCAIPIEMILQVFPVMMPRGYSISSSMKISNNIRLTAGIVRYKTNLISERIGTCSRYFMDLQANENIEFEIKKGTMNLPPLITNNSGIGFEHIPIIMIGPGTGIAAFLSFIEERSTEKSVNGNGLIESTRVKKDNTKYQSYGLKSSSECKTLMIFGNRNSEKDFLYKNELLNFVDKSHLELIATFSRDPKNPPGLPKYYVQNAIEDNGALIKDLILNKGAYLYVSGKLGKMPLDVKNSIKKVLANHNNGSLPLNLDDAENYLKYMIKTKRYQEECWN